MWFLNLCSKKFPSSIKWSKSFSNIWSKYNGQFCKATAAVDELNIDSNIGGDFATEGKSKFSEHSDNSEFLEHIGKFSEHNDKLSEHNSKFS